MLGPKLAVLLFQLPPTFKKDMAVLRDFLELLPDGTRAPSSSGTPRGTTPMSSTPSARATWRSASPTARR